MSQQLLHRSPGHVEPLLLLGRGFPSQAQQGFVSTSPPNHAGVPSPLSRAAILQGPAWALSISMACRHWSCSGSARAHQRETLLSALHACSTGRVLSKQRPRCSGRAGPAQHPVMASICPKASAAPGMGPQRRAGLRENHNCYQHSDRSDFSRMKREPSISSRGRMSFIFQPSSEKPKLPFLNMLRVWVIFQLPWGSGPQYKSGPTASSSILSSCLPLLREVGKSHFILPLVSLVGRTVFWGERLPGSW